MNSQKTDLKRLRKELDVIENLIIILENKKKELKEKISKVKEELSNQIKTLSLTIIQWELVYNLINYEGYTNLINAKREALDIMTPGKGKIVPFRLCFLCDEFSYYNKDGKPCLRCPMYGHWPAKNILGIKRKPRKRCNEKSSLYMYLESKTLSNRDLKYIKTIIDIMKKRLEELKNEDNRQTD